MSRATIWINKKITTLYPCQQCTYQIQYVDDALDRYLGYQRFSASDAAANKSSKF